MFMLLSAVLHIGDLRFTSLTDDDTAFPSDLQLLERGQCPPSHDRGHISTLGGGGAVRKGASHPLAVFTSSSSLLPFLCILSLCSAACQHELKARQSLVWYVTLFLPKRDQGEERAL